MIPPSGLSLNLMPPPPSDQTTYTCDPTLNTSGVAALAESLLRLIGAPKEIDPAANTIIGADVMRKSVAATRVVRTSNCFLDSTNELESDMEV